MSNIILSLALIACGIILIIYGVSAADSISSSFSRFFTGAPSDKAIWLIILGSVSCALGAGGFLFGRGRK